METNRLETLSKPATKRMEYHTERIVTLKIDPSLSWTVYTTAIVLGTFFVLGCWYLG
jgi:hypothetical protein